MRPLLAPLAAAAMLLSGCQQRDKALEVHEAWVKLPAVPGNPGAAYFTIDGGSEGAVLVKVAAPFALRSEMHESMAMDAPGGEHMTGMMGEHMNGQMGDHMAGAMTMAPIADVPVPAHGTLAFAPGGRHVMLYDISPDVKPGDSVPLRFEFAQGAPIAIEATVLAAGDPIPAD